MMSRDEIRKQAELALLAMEGSEEDIAAIDAYYTLDIGDIGEAGWLVADLARNVLALLDALEGAENG